MKIRSFLILLCTITGFIGSAQSGANIRLGLTGGAFRDEKVNLLKEFRPGIRVGIDARFAEEKWVYFGPGVEFYRFNIVKEKWSDGVDFFEKKERFYGMKFSAKIGFIPLYSKVLKIRIFGGACLYYLHDSDDYPALNLDIDDYKKFSYNFMVGAGVDIFFITLDVEYEHGMSPFLVDNKKSQLNTLSLVAGFFF